jgi:hypothetical protein
MYYRNRHEAGASVDAAYLIAFRKERIAYCQTSAWRRRVRQSMPIMPMSGADEFKRELRRPSWENPDRVVA